MAPVKTQKSKRRSAMRHRRIGPELRARMIKAHAIRRDKEREMKARRVEKLRKIHETRMARMQEQRDKEKAKKALRRGELIVRKNKLLLKRLQVKQRDKVRRARERLDRIAARDSAQEKAKEKAGKEAYKRMLKGKERKEKQQCRKKGANDLTIVGSDDDV